MKEDEDGAKELSDANEAIVKNEQAKVEAEAKAKADAEKAEAERQKAEYFKKHFKPDGLLHNDDGTRVDPQTGLIVGGVNNHAQIKSQSTISLMQQDTNKTVEETTKKPEQKDNTKPTLSASQSNSTTATNSSSVVNETIKVNQNVTGNASGLG